MTPAVSRVQTTYTADTGLKPKVDDEETRHRMKDYLVVPAASLLHALQAAMADDEDIMRRRPDEGDE